MKRFLKISKALLTLFDLCFFNVSFPSINSCNHYVVNEILSDVLIFEGDETKTTRLTCINIL